MTSTLRTFLCCVVLAANAGAMAQSLDFSADAGWLKLPEGRTEIGSMHGDVAVSAAGEIYISVEGSVRQRHAILGPGPGLQVYAPDGRFLRNVPDAPYDLHGFVIRQEADGEFLYGVRLAGGPTAADQARAGLDAQVIVKMTMDGKPAMSIAPSGIPDAYKSKSRDGIPYLRLTGIAVAPNGDIYVSDGYASDHVHRFDRSGRYISSFGGKQPPYGFRTLHKIAIDTRFTPARLVGIDRENSRLVHLSLEGEFIGVVAADLQRPAAVAIKGDHLAVSELKAGRISLLDRSGTVLGRVGENSVSSEVNINTTPPEQWRPGELTAPHGLTFGTDGELFVAEFNLFGRVHRFIRGQFPAAH